MLLARLRSLTAALRASRSLLSRKDIAVWAALIGVGLCLPALWVGWQLDDNYHRLILGHGPRLPGVPTGRFDLFRFVTGDAQAMADQMRRGIYPWWTLPELRLSFLR